MSNNTQFQRQRTGQILTWCIAIIYAPFFCNAQPLSCSEIFISEYVDGSMHDKALELFNPTDDPVDLQSYSVRIFHNGAPTPIEIQLTGTIAAKDVYILANPQAGAAVLNVSDQTSNLYNPNGDDAIVLTKGGAVVDLVGEIGINPGNAGWPVANGSTKEHTLIRKPHCQHGETNWTVCQNQWQIHPLNTLSLLGDHQSPCKLSQAYTIEITNFTFTFLDPDYAENSCPNPPGCIILEIEVSPFPIASGDVVNVDILPGFCNTPATFQSDYAIYDEFNSIGSQWSWNEFSFDPKIAGSIRIIDDPNLEPDETLCIELQSADASCGGTCNLSTIILDDDGVGIEELMARTGLEILPNPASERLTMHNLKGIDNIIVVNSLGMTIAPEVLASGGEKNIILNGLTTGIYYLQFFYKDQFYTHKFLKR